MQEPHSSPTAAVLHPATCTCTVRMGTEAVSLMRRCASAAATVFLRKLAVKWERTSVCMCMQDCCSHFILFCVHVHAPGGSAAHSQRSSALLYITGVILSLLHLQEPHWTIKRARAEAFFAAVEQTYESRNAYHNSTHAADVTQVRPYCCKQAMGTKTDLHVACWGGTCVNSRPGVRDLDGRACSFR